MGWVFKMLLIRDLAYSMFLSIYWEFSELIFNKVLPEFRECWWDSILLDIFLCNTVGIFIGYKLMKIFNLAPRCLASIKIYPNSDSKTEYGFHGKVFKRAFLLTYGSLCINVRVF